MKDGLLNQVALDCQEADAQIVEWEAKEQSLAAHQRDFENLETWMRSQWYSLQTIKTYLDSLRVLARWLKPVRLQQIKAEELVNLN